MTAKQAGADHGIHVRPLNFKKMAVVAMVVLIVSTAIGYLIMKQSQRDLNNVSVVQSRVARHMVLPKDKVPALATVTDKRKLTTKFLQQAENGDKLLIYDTEQKVIIYRPSIDKIIDVGPVTLASSKSTGE